MPRRFLNFVQFDKTKIPRVRYTGDLCVTKLDKKKFKNFSATFVYLFSSDLCDIKFEKGGIDKIIT